MATATKRRALSVAQTKRAEVEASVARKALTYYHENEAMNAAKKVSSKARKEGYKMMKEAGIESFIHKPKDANVTYLIKCARKKATYIDIDVLKKLVGENVFQQCISASKKDVEDFAGKDIAILCEKEADCPENLYVEILADE